MVSFLLEGNLNLKRQRLPSSGRSSDTEENVALPERIRGCQVYMGHIDESNDPAKIRKTACTIVTARHLVTFAHGHGEAAGSGNSMPLRHLPTDPEGHVLVSGPSTPFGVNQEIWGDSYLTYSSHVDVSTSFSCIHSWCERKRKCQSKLFVSQ